jgi:hypothetical protein
MNIGQNSVTQNAINREWKILLDELDAGRWLQDKARQWADNSGHYQAARNLRKWNVPLELALTLLL